MPPHHPQYTNCPIHDFGDPRCGYVPRNFNNIRNFNGGRSMARYDIQAQLDALEDRQIGAEILKRFKGRLTVALLAFAGAGFVLGAVLF